jgi:hypothetical protein
MVYTCMQKFRALQSVYTCKQIFLHLISYNFVQNLLHKSEFGQAHCIELLIRVHSKFTLSFLDLPTSFYDFCKFELNSGN